MSIRDEVDGLMASLAASSPLIDRVTADSAQVKPPAGKVHACVGPPSIEWRGWGLHMCSWDVWLVAGTASSQPAALSLLYQVLQDIEDAAAANVVEAEPAGWTRDGQKLAAYRITINKEDD